MLNFEPIDLILHSRISVVAATLMTDINFEVESIRDSYKLDDIWHKEALEIAEVNSCTVLDSLFVRYGWVKTNAIAFYPFLPDDDNDVFSAYEALLESNEIEKPTKVQRNLFKSVLNFYMEDFCEYSTQGAFDIYFFSNPLLDTFMKHHQCKYLERELNKLGELLTPLANGCNNYKGIGSLFVYALPFIGSDCLLGAIFLDLPEIAKHILNIDNYLKNLLI